MAVEVLAHTAGNVTLEPGGRNQRVRAKTKQIWKFPILDEDHEDYGTTPRMPPKWEILRTVGVAELAEHMAKKDKPTANLDKQRTAEEDPFALDATEPRGWSDADQALILVAVDALDDDNAEHWTGQGKPQVHAVQEAMERLHERETGERVWPSYLKRDAIDNVSDRRRQS